jgi:sortase A
MSDRQRERGSGLLRWLERLFLIAGAGTVVWCAVVVGTGVLAQRNARRALEIALAVDELTQSMTTSGEEPLLHLPSSEPSRRPTEIVGAAMAALSIPRVHLSAMVLHGSDAQTLQRGPGHIERTALPGDAGNIVIAGHRDSYFRPLRHIQLDDDIFLETRAGRFHYRVTSLRVVGPREVSVMAPASKETLTLITCYPFWVLGPAPDRFIVRAVRVGAREPARLIAWRLPARDWLDPPMLHPKRTPEARTTSIVARTDDDSLVRRAVRRYLVVAGGDVGACTIRVTGDRARADCESSVDGSRLESARGFDLERSKGEWAIKSIVLTSPPWNKEIPGHTGGD